MSVVCDLIPYNTRREIASSVSYTHMYKSQRHHSFVYTIMSLQLRSKAAPVICNSGTPLFYFICLVRLPLCVNVCVFDRLFLSLYPSFLRSFGHSSSPPLPLSLSLSLIPPCPSLSLSHSLHLSLLTLSIGHFSTPSL